MVQLVQLQVHYVRGMLLIDLGDRFHHMNLSVMVARSMGGPLGGADVPRHPTEEEEPRVYLHWHAQAQLDRKRQLSGRQCLEILNNV